MHLNYCFYVYWKIKVPTIYDQRISMPFPVVPDYWIKVLKVSFDSERFHNESFKHICEPVYQLKRNDSEEQFGKKSLSNKEPYF